MALRLSIGQYYPAESPIHRLDPRAKVGCALVAMASTFLIRTPLQLALGIALALALVAATRIPVTKVLESIRPLVTILVLLGLFNLFLVRDGETLFACGPLVIGAEGAWAAVLYSLRLAIAILMGALMMLTTTPTQLTDAFDAALSPLARLGLPAHEIAMVFSLMLRFIPTIADEAQAIADAQRTRGGALGEGSPLHRCHAIAAILVALFASSVRHANDLARALDARCYAGGEGRSHWHPAHMRPRDWAAVATCVACIAAILFAGTL